MLSNRIKSLNAQLRQARYDYYVKSEPTMSDAEYDALEKELRDLVATNPELAHLATVLQAVGSDIDVAFSQPIKHKVPMLSLENAYTREDVDFFIAKHPDDTTYSIEAKIDGLSLSARYADHRLFLALTRGTGTEGDDVTQAAMTIDDLPKVLHPSLPPDLEIRGEVFVSQVEFDRLNAERIAQGKEPYANQRNLASGSLKLKDIREVAKRKLSFQPWQIIGLEPPAGTGTVDVENPYLSLGERLEAPGHSGLEHTQALEMVHLASHTRQPHSWRVYSKAGLWDAIEKNRILRDTLWTHGLGMPTDGVVIKVEEQRYRDALGAGPKTVNWGMAYKFPADRATTTLRGVTWQVGRTGKLTPVAELEPVLVSGSTVRRGTLCNLTYLQRLGIAVNDKVTIFKGGEVIPQIGGVAEAAQDRQEILAPTHCPECGTEVTVRQEADGVVSHGCPSTSCPGRLIAHLIYLGDRAVMNIDGLGDVLADQFVRMNIAPTLGYLWAWAAEAENLVGTAEFEAQVAAAGFSVAQIRSLVASLIKARTAPWDKWLQGLGIPMIAREMAKVLANFLVLREDDLPNLCDKLLMLKEKDVEGLGPERLASIKHWAFNATTQADLELLHVSGVRPTSTILTSEGGEPPLKGYTICVTGEFGFPREVLFKILEGLGASAKTGMSKKVNLLLVGPTGAGRTKTAKAAELGTRTEGESWLRATFQAAGIPWPDAGLPSDEEMEGL